jgi:hypothetical protein
MADEQVKIQTRLHWFFFGSALLAGAGAALLVVVENSALRALGAYLAVFNGLYAIQWLTMSIRVAIGDKQ